MSKLIPLTKGQFAIVDDEDYERVSAYRWCYHPKGYAVTSIWIDGKGQTIYLHRFILGNAVRVDHRNRSKLDCRRENLRAATPSQNNANCTKRTHNTSGYKGVYRHSQNDAWVAAISYRRKTIYIGSFSDIIAAAKAYDQKARELYGEYANTNFQEAQGV